MNINIYNPYVREELYLMHHGIFGQRWGKRNGPPYPLGASDHSASEKKAGWRKSLADKREAKYYKKILINSKKESEHVNRAIDQSRNGNDNGYDIEMDKANKYGKKKYQNEKKLKSLENKHGPMSDKTKNKFKSLEDKLENKELKERDQSELAFLSRVGESGDFSDNDLKRYEGFQRKIVDTSIDWYEDKPKSERAKAWKKERDQALNNVEKTLGMKAKEAYKEYTTTRDNDPMWKFAGMESRKVKDLYEAYSKAHKEEWTAERAVRNAYDNKLVDVVLKDLGLPVTDENRKHILASQVLFWD